jgi:hypothetical protein
MQYSHPNVEPFMKIWDLLWKYGLAAQGTTGELIGRAHSISAMDHSINRLPNTFVRELKYQTPVTITDYYKALLTDEAWEELRHSTPANRAQLGSDSAKKRSRTHSKEAISISHIMDSQRHLYDAKYVFLGILVTRDSNCLSAQSGAYGSHDACISENDFCQS